MPKVSVITGYYNRVDALEATINSILGQTFTDFELIVFDDASTDGTAARLAELQRKLADPRLVCVIHDKNKGFTSGMIEAVAMARGQYIAVQGSGDISLPRRLEAQVAVLDERADVGAVGCWYSNVVAGGRARRLRQPDGSAATFEKLHSKNIFTHGEVMFRRSTYDAVGGYRAAFKFGQDYDLWLRMIKVASFATVPEMLYERFVRFDGVSYDPRKLVVQARYGIMARAISLMQPDEAAASLLRLEHEGPLAIVPDTHPALQKRYIRAAVRSLVWGGVDEARHLAHNNISNVVTRRGILAVAALLSTPLSSPFLVVLRRAFKIGPRS